MLRRGFVASLSVYFALAAGPAHAGASTNALLAPSGIYKVEAAHSQVLFSILHIGLTPYHGRFDRTSGTLRWNANQPEKSEVSIAIDMDGIDTPSTRLNDELKSKAVFDTAAFPVARFESTGIVRENATHGQIAGSLTIRNVTKPIMLDAVFRGTERNPLDDSQVLGFTATATIKRSDFGLTGMTWEPLVGDSVELTIEAMFQQASE